MSVPAVACHEFCVGTFAELYGAAVESSQHELFAFNPRMSYIYDEWGKSDPAFWKPKVASPAAKPAPEDNKAKP